VAGDVRPTLYVLLAAVGVTLLAACANVANMMVLRSAARRRELAVRATLGATRGSVIRLVSLESLALSAAAGAIGIGVARAALHVLVALAPYEMPRASEIALTGSAFAAGCAATLLAAAIVGLLPACMRTAGA
jgi:ABC-type antimicrobial peptide transport system permease subunit